MKYILLLLMLGVSYHLSAQAQDTITSAQANKYIGKKVTLCDRVNSGKYADISKEADIRLLVGPDYPNHNLTLIFPQAEVQRFTFDPEAKMINKRFCVQGTITVYRQKPAIYITKESQVNAEE